LGEDDIVFTGTHDNCLKELVRVATETAQSVPTGTEQSQPEEQSPAQQQLSLPQREQVAFVWDGALREGLADGLPIRRLELPALEQQRIPESAVIVRREFYENDSEFYDELLAFDEFQQLPDHQAKYKRILDWSREYGAEEITGEEGSGWEELSAQLRRFKSETDSTPRIALVLAGGGAKCAYQVGVAQVVEEKFRESRERDEELADCEISLVVGTSGGAINALPVAMGTYSSSAGIDTIETVWSRLDAREILQPEPAVCVGIGLTISLFYTLIILLSARLRWGGRRLFTHEQRAKIAVAMFWGIGGGHLLWWIVTYLTGWKLPWEYVLGNLHSAYVMWALAAAATWMVGIILTGLGTLVWLIDRRQRRQGGYLALSAAKAREIIVWLTLLTIVLGTPIVLAAASHFSMSKGLEQTIARAARDLINERLAARQASHVDSTDLHELSQAVLAPQNKLLEKDLIITATVLKGPGQQFTESEVYFYAAAGSRFGSVLRRDLNADKRFIDLERPGRRQFLLDAVLGSGAVFPFFPVRTLDNFPIPGQSLHLVDGSFGHHVPIEAALRWGATHIFIVDPTPAAPLDYRTDRSLLENSQVALGHLFEQAQKLDKQAQQSRVAGQRPPQIYRVNPKATKHHISLLSFASVPISYAIDEAVKSMSAGADRFLRQLNPPYFLPELDTLAMD
jgi:predicted acylesterase/phospholipase RssA